jgi:hypothetical protein
MNNESTTLTMTIQRCAGTVVFTTATHAKSRAGIVRSLVISHPGLRKLSWVAPKSWQSRNAYPGTQVVMHAEEAHLKNIRELEFCVPDPPVDFFLKLPARPVVFGGSMRWY